MGFTTVLSDDKRTLTIRSDAEANTLNAGEVSAAILALCRLRSQMQPELDADFASPPQVPEVAPIRVQPLILWDGSAASILHLDPAMGWVRMLLTPSVALAIVVEFEKLRSIVSVPSTKSH